MDIFLYRQLDRESKTMFQILSGKVKNIFNVKFSLKSKKAKCTFKSVRRIFLSACGLWSGHPCKLMRSNQPPAKIGFKLYSNRILINFFDPKSSPDFIRFVVTIKFNQK